MIIDVKDLKKRYKKQPILKGIDIQINTPQIVALVGPKGSGKTTLLNCLTNLLVFDEGSVSILDKKHTDPSLFYEVSYLQSNGLLYGNLTAYDHLKFICQMQQLAFSRINEVAERVGITSYLKKRVQNYSPSMKQHLLLAMSIINMPKLLLLDEPFKGLDRSSATHILNILLELYKEGTTIIFAADNLYEIDKLSHAIYLLKDGVLFKESLDELFINQYDVTVSNFEKAKGILQEQSLAVELTEHNTFSFDEKEISFQTFIDLLNKNDVQIEKVENAKVGAKKRYIEYFERELSL